MNKSPSVILFYGDDVFGIEEHVQKLLVDMKLMDNGQINVSKFQASSTNFGEIRSSCRVVPFLGDSRIVLLTDVIQKGKKTKASKLVDELIKFLPDIPFTTLLLIIEPSKLASNSKLLKAVKSLEYGKVYSYMLPDKDKLVNWIRERTRTLGGEITLAGANALADIGTNDTRRLSSEIDKLLAYVNWEDSIDIVDVVQLVPAAGQADIFLLVDSVAHGNAHRAVSELYRLISSGDRDHIGIFAMIVRQYRLLLQVKEILDAGGNVSVIKIKLGLHDFVANKLVRQSHRYTIETLEYIYKRLGAMDLAMKTGADHELALDIMVAGLTS